MNIWIINHYAIPYGGSGPTRHYALAANLIERGNQVSVIASSFDHFDYRERREVRLKQGEAARLETIDGVPFLWIRACPYGGNAKRLCNMMEYALRVSFGSYTCNLPQPEIILGSSMTLLAALSAYRIARKLGVPFILEVRDVWPQTMIDLGVSPWNPVVLMFGVIERFLYRHADAIITLLPGAVSHIRSNGARTQEIMWLPNAVDFTLSPLPERPIDKLPFKVMFAGSHSLANSPETLLEAAEILQDQGRRDIEICFIGDGPHKAELMRLKALKKLTNVEFRAPVSKREIFGVLSEAGAVVALLKDITLYRFGISMNKLYDYMASARPVLFAARSFNNPVSESRCGMVIPPENPQALADAIIRVAEMPIEERWEMGLRGRRFVEEYHNVAKASVQLESFMVRTMESYRASRPHKRSITK